jgi:hypothetical protein
MPLTRWYAASVRQSSTTLALAREERLQRRIEASYIELQRAVNRFGVWAEGVMPFVTPPGYNPYPTPPGNEAIADAGAFQVYWSPEVRRLVDTWTKARNALIDLAVEGKQDEVRGTAPGAGPDPWQRAPEVKATLRNAEDALITQTSKELRESGPLTAPNGWLSRLGLSARRS